MHPPESIGQGPEWSDKKPSYNDGGGKRKFQNKKKNFRHKKPQNKS